MSSNDEPTREDRIYDQVLRMVLWGESEEKALQKLEVNGFIGKTAQEMYARARKERVSAIRKDCLKSVAWGLPWLAAGATALYGMWFVAHFVSAYVLMLAVGAVAIGGWKVSKGLIGFLAAPYKTGSLADGD